MAETTTAQNACNVAIHMDDSSGIPVDVSGSANRVEPSFSQQIGEFQVFGGAWLKRLVCKKDASLNIQLVFSTAANEGWKLLKDWWTDHNDEARTIRFMVPDEGVGSDDFQGEFLISTWNAPFDGTQAGPILLSMTLVQTGGVTIGTVAT